MKRDKFLHLTFSAIILLISTILATRYIGYPSSLLFGVLFSFAVGIIKEYIWDLWLHRGKFDYADLLYDWYGILIGILIYKVVLYLVSIGVLW